MTEETRPPIPTAEESRCLHDGMRLTIGALLATLTGQSAAPVLHAVWTTTDPEQQADVLAAAFLAAVALVPLAAEVTSPDQLVEVLLIEAAALAAEGPQ